MKTLHIVLVSLLLLCSSLGYSQQYNFESQRWCQGSESFGCDCMLSYDFHRFTISPQSLKISSMGNVTEYPLVKQLMAQEYEEYYDIQYMSNMEIQIWVRVYKAPQDAEGYTYLSELMIIDYGMVNKYFIGGDLLH